MPDTSPRSPDTDHDHGSNGAPPALDEGFWDERYRSKASLWSGEPNRQLVAEVGDRSPGRALDAGCGEGADAIWLARRGWRVTAVDFSGVALDRARAHAVDAGPEVTERIEWVQADLASYEPEPRAFDLVSAQFIHLPPERRSALHRHLAEAVATGGTLLIVGHDRADLDTGVRRPPFPELYAPLAETTGLLPEDGWTVEVAETRPYPATDPDGNEVTVHDAVVRARRTG